MLHEVLKDFKGEGVQRTKNEIVETSGWKNERILKEHRFIGVPSTTKKNKATAKAGTKPKQVAKEPEKTKDIPPTAIPKVARAPRPLVLRKGGKKSIPTAKKVVTVKTKG